VTRRPPAPDGAQPLRVGIVGIGHWGRQLVRVFHEEGTVAGCASRGSTSSREWLASAYPDIPFAAGVDALLEDPAVEAIVVATPVATHAALVQKALDAGKHVFAEKPMTDSSEAAAKLAACARDRGLALFVGHVMLHEPFVEHLQRLVATDPARFFSFTWQRYGPFREAPAWEFLPHPLAIAIQLFGRPPVDVRGAQQALGPQARLLHVELDFRPGRCEITVDTGFPIKRSHGTLQTASGAILTWEDGRLQELGADGYTPVPTASSEPLRREAAAFIDLVRTPADRRSYESAELGVEVVRVIEALVPQLR
jgi:predicted dehydrogenase